MEDVITAPPPALHYCELLPIALLTSTQLMNNNYCANSAPPHCVIFLIHTVKTGVSVDPFKIDTP